MDNQNMDQDLDIGINKEINKDLETNTDSTRKLASVQIITTIDPHPDADRLFLATVLGWQIVVSRDDDVKEGDKIIYCEIDSVLPKADWIPPAVQERFTADTYRLKTVKLRKQISQGLIVPISSTIQHMADYEIGTDVTAELGIGKYEPPALDELYQGGNSEFRFPSNLVDKTDETRIQSKTHYLSLLNGNPYYIGVKCDGTSGTFLIDPETKELICCSRNWIRKRPDEIDQCPYWKLAVKYDLEQKLLQFPELYAIQGEICGPKIQKNLLNLKELDLFVFTVYRNGKRLTYQNLVQFCDTMGLKMVPIVEAGKHFSYTLPELLQKAEGKYTNSKNQREGLVVRSQDQTISFKVINNAYLLKNNM